MNEHRTKVLHVLGNLGIGGTERQQTELLKCLPPERFEQLVATMQADGPFLGEITALGVEVVRFPFTSFCNRTALHNYRALAKLIRQRQIEIVHCHDFYSNIFGTAAATLAGRRAPGCRVRIITSRRDLGGMYSFQKRAFQRAAQTLSAAVMVNSDAVRQMLLTKEHFPARKVHRIYNCLDSVRFQPREPDPELVRSLGLSGAPVMGVVASLHPWKGHRTFIRAAAIVHQARPDVRYLIVGGGSELEALQALAAELGIADCVIFAGPRKDVPELLALMNLFVLSSPSEGLPNAVLEAMACARPVVATAGGGTAEAVSDGVTGFLVPVDDHAALAEKALLVLNDPALAASLGAAGRQRVLDEFSRERLISDVESLYTAVLAGRR